MVRPRAGAALRITRRVTWLGDRGHARCDPGGADDARRSRREAPRHESCASRRRRPRERGLRITRVASSLDDRHAALRDPGRRQRAALASRGAAS
ncbi:hypothetical protein DB32_006658 [Sandaracinus amylolyticus]|uniref:Uncharacterized protein n=1 Tax=Sandaracinus amylolyticus TaxID=927083 RepID=A0A0F6SGY6_9BACT|nr:hypothetical protein DB32_006658 [Sandaracinus amylolyticus]